MRHRKVAEDCWRLIQAMVVFCEDETKPDDEAEEAVIRLIEMACDSAVESLERENAALKERIADILTKDRLKTREINLLVDEVRRLEQKGICQASGQEGERGGGGMSEQELREALFLLVREWLTLRDEPDAQFDDFCNYDMEIEAAKRQAELCANELVNLLACTCHLDPDNGIRAGCPQHDITITPGPEGAR